MATSHPGHAPEKPGTSGALRSLSPLEADPGRSPGAFIRGGNCLVISDLEIRNDAVVHEASRWTSGERREPVRPSDADGADVTPFVTTAVEVYAMLIAAAGEASSIAALRGSVSQLTEQARAASTDLVGSAKRASTEAVEATVKATREAMDATAKTIGDAGTRVEAELGKIVQKSTDRLTRELDGLVGGDTSRAATAIRQIVAKAMTDAQVAWHQSLTSTLTEVSKSFDTSNPASPFAALERRVQEQQAKQHADLTARLDKVQEAVSAATQAADKSAAIAQAQAHSPAKGSPYEDRIGAIIEGLTSALTATYTDTSNTVGKIRMCKKGDGVVEAAAIEPSLPPARVVIECTTSESARNWAAYLTEAEKNRECQASLGIVPTRNLVPGGDLLALVGPSRIVLAYQPDEDDPSLIRAALQLLLVEAQRRLAAGRGSDLTVADSKIAEARQQLLSMHQVIKTAVSVRDNAGKVVTGLESMHGTLTLLLEQAQGAMRGGGSQPATAQPAA